MKKISGIFRVLAGLAIIVLIAIVFFQNMKVLLSDAPTASLYGYQLSLSGTQIMIGLGILIVLALIYVVYGVISMFPKKIRKPDWQSP